MRSIGRLAALSTFLLAAVAAAQNPRPWASKVPSDLARKANPAPNTPQILAEGKELYTNTCLPCHGELAQGDGPAAAFIVPPPKPLIVNGKISVPDGVAFWVITNGIDGTGMASLGDTLTEQERWKVIRYLQVLAAPPAPAATPVVAVTPAVPAVSPAVPLPTATVAPVASPVPVQSPKAAATPKKPAR